MREGFKSIDNKIENLLQVHLAIAIK